MANQSTAAASESSESSASFAILNGLFGLTSIRDVDQVLQQALSVAARGLGAEAGSLLLQDNNAQRARFGAFHPDILSRIEHWEDVIGRRLTDSNWTIPAEDELPISTSKGVNQRLLVNIPLLKDITVVGSLSLVLPEEQELTADQRQLLSLIAKSVGHLTSLIIYLDHTEHRIEQMGVFHQVGQALVTTFDINRLLSDTMQLAANVIDAGAASIMLIDEEQKDLVFEITHGSRSQMLRQQRIPLDEGIGGWVARHGHPVIANNARTDPRFSHRVDVRTGFLTQSIAAVPLQIKGRIIGVLEVLNKYSGDGFDNDDIRLMSSIAAQAAIAIENARLYQQVSQERDQVIRAQESLRGELARNLHDGPVQLLSAISTSLDHLERLNKIKPEAVQHEIGALRNLVHEAIRDTRNVLFELRPVILQTQGLVAALEQFVEQIRQSETFTLHFTTVESVQLDLPVSGAIFSIVQEAFNNIRRHAEARNVWLSLEIKDERLVITLRDDGRGFNIAEKLSPEAQQNALGLLNMKERAELIEAQYQLESRTDSPNRGTLIQLILPLPKHLFESDDEDLT